MLCKKCSSEMSPQSDGSVDGKMSTFYYCQCGMIYHEVKHYSGKLDEMSRWYENNKKEESKA
ncbi:hypothetical protein [Bacillus cereus group sp. BfR-BA-01380]|uniref:hypothetical protein n=1 Tax=Bacillus cereus group sp. BfR-BA-01380 TaxID=2920324 RepID=UPI001F588711|nr:hypothetical protein [Bacillus cereus group sp. BfR-BA-01380]